MSADLRQIALKSALFDLSDGLRWLGPSGSFRFFRWLPRHAYPELWMSDPGRDGAIAIYPFNTPIPAAGFFSREIPAVEQARRYFVQAHNTVFQAFSQEPHRTYSVGASGFVLTAVFTGSFQVQQAPLKLELSIMRRPGTIPTLGDARQRTAGRFLKALRLSPNQSALWMGEVLRASDSEDAALGAALLDMQLRRPEIAEMFEACRRAYPAYYIGRPGPGPAIMLGFGPSDVPALLAIDQPDDGAALQEDAKRRDLWRQAQRVRNAFAR